MPSAHATFTRFNRRLTHRFGVMQRRISLFIRSFSSDGNEIPMKEVLNRSTVELIASFNMACNRFHGKIERRQDEMSPAAFCSSDSSSRWLAMWLAFVCGTMSAQVADDFEVRFSAQEKGGIWFLANHSLSCEGNGLCADALASLPISGNAQENNNAFEMTYVDVDDDSSTWSSSSDSLNLGGCAEVLWAGLYWAGRVDAYTPNLALRDQVKIRAGNGPYVEFTADELLDFNSGYFDAYFCFTDVTDWITTNEVQARYTVANVVGEEDFSAWAGWTLVIAYRDALDPIRNLTVFDGLAFISYNEDSELDVPISGFVTPVVGPVELELGVVAYDGDRGATGDQMAFNGAGSYVYIEDATHDVNNTYNSTHSRNGVIQPWRIPAANNTLGHDANIFVPDNSNFNYLANGATDAVIRMSTNGESVMIQTVSAVVDVFEPDLKASVFIEDLNGGLAQPGDLLQYTVVGKNLGTDFSTGTFIVDTLDFRTSYVPGSLEMLTGPGAGPLSDDPGDDQGEYDPAIQAVRVRVGTDAGTVVGGDLANDPTGADSVAFRFQVQLTDDCLILQCDGTLSDVAHIFGTGDISGNSQTNNGLSAQVDADGCSLDSGAEVTVATGNCSPVSIEPLGPACLGSDVELAVPAIADNPLAESLAQYAWSGPGGFVSDQAVAEVYDLDATSAGVYALEITFAGQNCLLNTADYELIVHEPQPAIDAPDSVCFDGHAVDFTGQGALYPDAEYSWEFEGAVAAFGVSVADVVFEELGWHEVALTLTEQGCTTSVIDSVYLEATPPLEAFPVNGLQVAGCPPLLVQPSAMAPVPVALDWQFGDGAQSTASEPVHAYETPGTYDVTVSAVSTVGCPASVSFLVPNAVTVHDEPVAGFEIEPNVVNVLEGTVQLTSLAAPNDAVSYWMADGGSLSTPDGFHTFTEGGTFNVVQTVVDANGCVSTATGEVAVSGTVFFAPTAFTPDENGRNEVWKPEVTGVLDYRLEVFNRWGERIWWSEDHEEPWLGDVRDGSHFVPNGLYLWKVRFTDQLRFPQQREGTVWLLR